MRCSTCHCEFEGVHKSDAGPICDACADDIMDAFNDEFEVEDEED